MQKAAETPGAGAGWANRIGRRFAAGIAGPRGRRRLGRAAAIALAVSLAAGCTPDMPSLTECEARAGWAPICGFTNPEDLAALPGESWLVVSEFPQAGAEPGSLVGMRIADGRRRRLFPAGDEPLGGGPAVGWGAPSCPGPPDVALFTPHGIDVGRAAAPHRTLAVVNHGGRESIELFEVGYASGGPALRWRGCVVLPPEVWPNDVTLLADGGLLVTNMMPGVDGAAALFAAVSMLMGLDTGSVLEWHPGGEWTAVPESHGSGPNGVAASRDGREIYFSEWAGRRLVRLRRDASGGSVRDVIELSHHPDNITWTRDGRLLVASQEGPLPRVLGCGTVESGTCALPFSVTRVDPVTFDAVTLLEDPATVTGAASVALEVGDAIYIGTFAGDRVASTSLR